jgi:hypothetical protein
MKSILLSLIVLTTVGMEVKGQPSNTIYQTFATNSTISTEPVVFYGPVFPNIGQTFHQGYLSITAQAGHVGACTGGILGPPTLILYGSYNSNPASVTQPIVIMPQKTFLTNGYSDGNSYTYYVQGTGAFPYIWLGVTGVDNINCQFSVYYTGTVYPFAAPTPGLISTNYLVSTIGDNIITPTTLTGYVPFNPAQIVVSNTTAGQTVILKCGNGLVKTYFKFENMAAGQTVVLPFTGNSYAICDSLGAKFTANLTAATEVSITVYFLNGGNVGPLN